MTTQEPQQENAKPEMVMVQDLDHFINLLVRWHDTKVRVLKHMESIPEDAVVEIEGVDHKFTAEMRQGFKVGITVALAELGTLPFGFETDDESPVTDEQPEPKAA